MRNTDEVRDGEDREVWRQQFTSKPRRPRGQERRRKVKTVFRAPLVPDMKTKREPEDGSSVVTGGESVVGVSGPSSARSSCRSTRSGRDWYNPHNWRHGGLRWVFCAPVCCDANAGISRIKEEIKEETEENDLMDGEPSVKRRKMGKMMPQVQV